MRLWLGCDKMAKTETFDLNPYYGADNMEDRTEVKDVSEYYEYAKAEDNIVFTDTNDNYEYLG